jgi:hypothetical protein
MKILKEIQRLCLFLILVFALILHSCVLSDCWYDYKWIIENKTNSNIRIYYRSFDIYPEIDTTIILTQDSSKVILTDGYLDGCTGCWLTKNCGPDSRYGQGIIDSIYITMNDTMETKIYYSDYKKWSFSTDGDLGFYKISLTNTDFENR